MKVFSMFSGIGGFELGIKNTIPNAEFIGYSEIDKYATQIYERNFKGVKNYGDATKINERELPDFDLLVGGFPCQAFSIAGKRLGFRETRGTLFFDIARILSHKKPRHFILENVRGLFSHDSGRTFQTILRVLSDIGYMVQWELLNSKNFGVPQNRERIYLVGHLRGRGREKVFPIGQISKEDSKESRLKELTENKSQAYRVYDQDGLATTIKSVGGGVGAKTGLYKVKEATKTGYAIAQEGDSINLSVPSSKTRRGRVGRGVAQTLDTGMQQHTLQNSKIRRLTPIECERLQGFPDGWTEGLSDTQRYKCLGNAVTTNVVSEVIRSIYL
tara:strand:+ start:231 stop:1220 length:990 start_codon:yes stop_codon:yes gene_type:complete